MTNLPLLPHQIYNNDHQQQPNNLLSSSEEEDGVTSLLHQIYNNGHQQQQPNNLLSLSEDGLHPFLKAVIIIELIIFITRWVTSLPQSGNNHRGRIFFSVLEQWRRFDNNGHQQQQHNLLSSEDGVTSLPQSGNHHHQRSSSVLEQWRRPRLDTDNIPYEQLLELQERIGNINTGLSVENITTCLKTRTVTSGDVKDEKIFNETCIVCQDEYKDNHTIGALECGHEYHRECIKEWLLLKNLCPICKRPALSTTN